MARVAAADWINRSPLSDCLEDSAENLEEGFWESKRVRFFKGHSPGLAKCSNCGADVKIYVSPKRNPHSGKLGRAVTLKDHDLCRRCWRQIVRLCRDALLTEDYSAAFKPSREVA